MIIGHCAPKNLDSMLTQHPFKALSSPLKTNNIKPLSSRKLLINRCCALALLLSLNITTYILIQFVATHF